MDIVDAGGTVISLKNSDIAWERLTGNFLEEIADIWTDYPNSVWLCHRKHWT